MKSTRKDKLTRFLYGLFFVTIWIAGMYYILGFTTKIHDSGSTVPTGDQIVPDNNHGDLVYITETQYFFKELYGFGFALSFLGWIILGIVLQTVYNVEIFRTGNRWSKPPNPGKGPPQDTQKN